MIERNLKCNKPPLIYVPTKASETAQLLNMLAFLLLNPAKLA